MKCDNCGIKCENLSRLNTCPDCVAKWVKEYSDLHKLRTLEEESE